MLINNKSLGLGGEIRSRKENSKIKDIIKEHYSKKIEQEKRRNSPDFVLNEFKNLCDTLSLMVDNSTKNYLITKSVMDEIIPNIKIDKKTNNLLRVFRDIPEGDYSIFFNENRFINFKVKPNRIYFCSLNKNGTTLDYMLFFFNTEKGTINIEEISEDQSGDIVDLIIKLLLYIFKSDIRIEEIDKNSSNNKTKNDGKIVNQTDFKIKIVDSKWNIISIYKGDIKVKGHFRLQRFGEKRSQEKLIFIAPFNKKGYKRNKNKINDLA